MVNCKIFEDISLEGVLAVQPELDLLVVVGVLGVVVPQLLLDLRLGEGVEVGVGGRVPVALERQRALVGQHLLPVEGHAGAAQRAGEGALADDVAAVRHVAVALLLEHVPHGRQHEALGPLRLHDVPVPEHPSPLPALVRVRAVPELVLVRVVVQPAQNITATENAALK